MSRVHRGLKPPPSRDVVRASRRWPWVWHLPEGYLPGQHLLLLERCRGGWIMCLLQGVVEVAAVKVLRALRARCNWGSGAEASGNEMSVRMGVQA